MNLATDFFQCGQAGTRRLGEPVFSIGTLLVNAHLAIDEGDFSWFVHG